MDETTEDLRDIFIDVTDEQTVTESQTEGRGSLTKFDDGGDERLTEVIERLRDRYAFYTDLDDATLREIVRAFYDGDDDETIAAALDLDPDTVFHARMDLHLLSEGDTAQDQNHHETASNRRTPDTDFPFDLATVRSRLADIDTDANANANDPDPDPDTDEIATMLDSDESTVERAIRVVETQDAIRTTSRRFQSEFEDALPEAALAVELTNSVNEDGLEEAAADIETDTKF